ncbi:MAG TPA: exodeoxyribonuclease VII large subunit [Caldimonas sp.]|nr:exodeoxyribonuclease VII large subunit [Caldimonas sp.]HEV7575587.1 exodeoxyribonuclease VII large subunit [Caldimonas sp.]
MGEPSGNRLPGRIWGVAALVHAVASLLEQELAACTVGGEISGFSRAASGHCYFTLKDPGGGAALRCAMFRRAASLLDFAPIEGQRVELRGRIAVYEPRGELQFIVEAMQSAGAGALYERFLRLRAKLEAEGLFDPASKRALPVHPRAIGVVTSLAGAALHDVATTLARRSPHVQVVIYPSVVQGADAPAALCTAIAIAARRGEVDVLIVCRGGGSLEDLWAFNDERVVRAIRAAPMPVVSGIGHETDVTLADLAADLRAATPTAAAELVAPATAAQERALQGLEVALARRTLAGLETQAQRLDRLGLRLARPSEALARRAHVLDLLEQRLAAAPARALSAGRSRSDAAAARLGHALAIARSRIAGRVDGAGLRLEALDPQRVLARGYALLVDRDDRPVTSVTRLAVGDAVIARLADGRAELTTTAVEPAQGPR